ncbi:MAG TPA: hypothetical protein VFG68_03910, partial [Fimbriiglobus sp.]|nr:hypothetical protein [Fimbriiglobus sp.]
FDASGLVGTPTGSHVYVGIPALGVYRSIDFGQNWTLVNGTGGNTIDVADATRVILALHDQDVVYAGVIAAVSSTLNAPAGGTPPAGQLVLSVDDASLFEPDDELIVGEATTTVAAAGSSVTQFAVRSLAGFVVGMPVRLTTAAGTVDRTVAALHPATSELELDTAVTVAIGDTVVSKSREVVKVASVNPAANSITLKSLLTKVHFTDEVLKRGGAASRLRDLYRTGDQGGSWTKMADPGDSEGGLHPGAQANVHFSIVASPTNPNEVYVGGDTDPNPPFRGRLFRGVFGATTGTTANQAVTNSQWFIAVDAGANSTAPHADSRVLLFAPDGNLLEADDGGLFRLTTPSAATRVWNSVNGDLRLTEFISVAYDVVNDVIFGGAQDNGTPRQNSHGSFTWTELFGGDGGIVLSTVEDGKSIKYISAQNLGGFQRIENLSTDGDLQGLEVNGTGLLDDDEITIFDPTVPFITQYAINAIDPQRILLGTSFLYETDDDFLIGGDPGDDFTLQNGEPVGIILGIQKFRPPDTAKIGEVSSIAYGGRERNGSGTLVDKPDVAWVGTVDGPTDDKGHVYVRVQAGQNFRSLPSWQAAGGPNGAKVADLAINADNWHEVYVLTTGGKVWRGVFNEATGDVTTWTDLTGNLNAAAGGVFSGDGAQTIELFLDRGATATSTADDKVVVLVGGRGGVFRLVDTASPATGWSEYGAGLANTIVTDLRYYPQDDLLLAGTLGRGAWTVPNASRTLTTPETLQVFGDAAAADSITLKRRTGQPRLLDVSFGAGDPVATVPVDAIGSIVLDGRGGNDKYTIDGGAGPIAVAGGITIAEQAGAGTDEIVFGPQLQLTGKSQTGSVITISGKDAFGVSGDQKVTLQNVETVPAIGTIAFNANPALGGGLGSFADASGGLLADALAGANFGLFDPSSLADGANGDFVELPTPPRDLFGVVSRTSPNGGLQLVGGSFLRRLFETGDTVLNIADIGTALTTKAQIEAALDALGDVTVTDLTPGDLTDELFQYDVDFSKTLRGVIDLAIAGDAILNTLHIGDVVDLSGSVEVTFLVEAHLSFGVDADGFFVIPTAEHEFVIRDIQIAGDGVRAGGKFGFLTVELRDAELTIDPSVQLRFDLNDPSGDGKIRVSELAADPGSLISFALASGGTNEVVFGATLAVGAIIPGLGDLGLTDTHVSFAFD